MPDAAAHGVLRSVAAEEAGVPVTEDPAAVAPVTLDLDAVVPPALFDALAAIIAWAYRQEGTTAR